MDKCDLFWYNKRDELQIYFEFWRLIMTKAAIFDFDGTLANTLPDLKITINLTRAHYDLPPVTEADVLVHVSQHLPRYIELMIPEITDPKTIDEAVQIYYGFYDKHYLNETCPYPGIVDMLKKLKAEGVKLGVLSNKNHKHTKEMTEALFPDIFDSIWGSVPEVPAKPNPARAHMMAADFGCEMGEIAYVGDSDIDMKTGVNGGMTSIGVAWGYCEVPTLRENGAKTIVNDADELYLAIKNI